MAKEKQPRNLKDALAGKLSKKEMEKVITSFDSLGNIALIQIPKELEKKAKVIGEALLSINRQFETICMVTGEHKGIYRLQAVKVIAGKKSTKALYKESGCSFNIELGKVFFSPRLGTERARIAGIIKKGEVVGAFFAGVGPFPIVFAKNSEMEKAYAIELNPAGYKGMVENIALNKVEEKVEAILGDVHKVIPKRLLGMCDRIVMPLPKGGENFLKDSMLALKKEGGIVHFYRFVEREGKGAEALAEIEKAAKEIGMKVKILRKERVRNFSPKVEQIVVDFFAKPKGKISKKEILAKIKELGLEKKGFDLVVGIGKGGKEPAKITAKELGLKCRFIEINFRDSENKPKGNKPKLLKKPGFLFKGKKILIVDDVCNSGKTIAETKNALKGAKTKSLAINCMNKKTDFCLFNYRVCVGFPWKKV